ncbi:MAG: restriction endonuclease [Candidatus Contendobacter sp.]|nr:restriction endonuclease [Candidatus Contendobacter sp.]
MNTLFFGDCLNIIRDQLAADSVDLIYLDPPFNSNRDYNLLFKTPKGHAVDAQINAFDDTWHWGPQAESEFDQILHQSNTEATEVMQSLRRFLRENDLLAYLTMMASRLLELHRVLKATGSLYLHCDPTASHYLKIVLDAIFGKENFRNEIIWKRTSAHANVGKRYASIQDRLLFYTKSSQWHWQQPFLPYSEKYIKSHYGQVEPETEWRFTTRDLTASIQRASKGQIYDWKGVHPPSSRCWAYSKDKMEHFEKEGKLVYSERGIPRLKLYLKEMPGIPLDDIWTDLPPINSQAAERLGYPTQKPLALLERIIQVSSSEGDLVLDPFCGCGTAVHAAHKLDRNWIGIDITHLAIGVIEQRLNDAFPGMVFAVEGAPKDLASAQDLAKRNKYQFQWWACWLIKAQPYQGKKKGADSGIDGLIYFRDDDGLAKKIIVSVKGGDNINVSMVRDLKGVLEREKAQIGLFVTLTPPTQPMIKEAVTGGYYESPLFGSYPRIQLLTIDGLLAKTERALYPDLSQGGETFKQAKVETRDKQDSLI